MELYEVLVLMQSERLINHELVLGGSFPVDYATNLVKGFINNPQSTLRPDILDKNRSWYRLSQIASQPVLLEVSQKGMVSWYTAKALEHPMIEAHIRRILRPIHFPAGAEAHLPINLASQFSTLSPLVHIASDTLHQAVIKAVIRQVIRASHARQLIQRFSTSFGDEYRHKNLIIYQFPRLQQILNISINDLSECGLGYKSQLIKHIASVIEEDKLNNLADEIGSRELLAILQGIRGVGNWTASVALCDLTGDWSLYPFDDLAVRTWAAKLWPRQEWPTKPEEFKTVWMELNGIYTPQVTFYLLALAARHQNDL